LLTESNPALGVYTDFIGTLGGPVNFVLAPGEPAWVLGFDGPSGLGVGSFAIDPGAGVGSVNSGTLRVIVEAYSQDPAVCGGACVTETLTLDTAFSATASDVPEPSTFAFLAIGGLLLLSAARRRP
jgi:hypothetical protein